MDNISKTARIFPGSSKENRHLRAENKIRKKREKLINQGKFERFKTTKKANRKVAQKCKSNFNNM